MAGRLDGKVIIVAGAASRGEGVGNGKAMSMLFAREGAKVVLVNRSGERAEALRQEIERDGGAAMVVAADVTRTEDVALMLAATEERFGRLDGLVNNVGIGSPGKIEDIAEEDWDRVVEANLKSAMKCTRAAVPAMKRAGGGAILNISSIAGASGLISDAGAVVYATTKAGLHGFTLSVAADYAADGIRSNCLIVGSVDTPMVAHMGEAARQRRIDMVPLGKGTAWDVAWAAVYLMSDEARWVTGAILPVDGGLLALRVWPR